MHSGPGEIGHALLHLAGPVELAELGPLGHQHGRVGAGQRIERGRRHLSAAQQLAGAACGLRVVHAHVRALALEPGREDEARGLAHVVGVRLEGDAEKRDLLPDE